VKQTCLAEAEEYAALGPQMRCRAPTSRLTDVLKVKAMPVFEMQNQGLAPVASTSFEAEWVTERGDIQRLIRSNIECLEEGLLAIAQEFSDWQDSSRMTGV
jgi:hypothetical protein